MRIQVKKLGIIESAVLDLEKQLILFCGRNSTGKTYLSYIVYALLGQVFFPSSFKNKVVTENDDGSFICRLIGEELLDFKRRMVELLKTRLDELFGMPLEDAQKMFSSLDIHLDTTLKDCNEKILNWTFDRHFSFNWGKFHAVKSSQSDEVLITPEEGYHIPTIYRDRFLIPFFYKWLTTWPVSSVAIFPVERNSIYTFSRELSISRNALVDHMQRLPRDKELDLFDVLESGSKRYPKAISDGIIIANDLTNLKKTPGPYYDLACELEQEMLHGSLNVGQDGDVEFLIGDKKRRRHLPIHITASLIKTMASFFFYLKYKARENDLFIIDEPEMNMHPDTQVLFVRFIVRLISEKLRFLISTHSDYIIREINYFIMKKKIADVGIERDAITAYYFELGNNNKVFVKEIPIDEFGLRICSIDNVIEDQNERCAELIETLLGKNE